MNAEAPDPRELEFGLSPFGRFAADTTMMLDRDGVPTVRARILSQGNGSVSEHHFRILENRGWKVKSVLPLDADSLVINTEKPLKKVQEEMEK